jgi:hypothetical protein
MAISAKITLTTAGGNTGPFDLYSNPISPSINGTLFASGITRSDLLLGYTSDVVPTGTSVIRCKSNNGICINYQDFSLILPTLTPTPTKTLTPTPTPTGYKYFLLLDRCDFAPGIETGWTANSYTINQCTYGDIFATAGGFFSIVINSSLTDMGGTIQGSKNISGFTSCEDTPGHYIAPVYRTAKFKGLFRFSGYTSYTQIQANMCDKDPSQIYPNVTQSKGNIYADPSVTGQTLTPGVLYDLYEDWVDGTPKWTGSGSYWWGAIIYNTNSKVDYIVRIENGTITEWRDCTTGEIIYV